MNRRKGGGATSITFTLLDLAGIVALLLWGVHMVQTGVQRALGARLRTFLARSLGTRIGAFGSGVAITTALQSGTATGLMVASFARQGLVTLSQGLAVMLGANVGSTLIVQILAFDIARVAPVLVLAGYLLFRRAKAGLRDFGRVLIGLGLVLLALHLFLALLAPLTANPAARGFLTAFSTHIVFIVLLGTLLTWAAHSSVAVVLLAMTLATQGALDVPAGIALALGANMGSAINPVVEGNADSLAGRRVPIGNLLNRLVGALAVLAIFPLVPRAFTAIASDPARSIADFHTGFNLVLAILFFPFLHPFARLLERLLPAREDEGKPDAPRYLEVMRAGEPVALALGGATRETLRLVEILETMLAHLRHALETPDRGRIEEARRLDDRLDHLSRAIKQNLIAIDPERLDEAGDRQLRRILTFSINLEQAGDLIDRGLLGIAGRRLKRGVSFSPQGTAELIGLVDQVAAILRTSTDVFLTGDGDAARRLAERKQALREADQRATAAHFERLRSGEIETIETSALHLDALRDLHQIGSHLIEASAYPILKQRGELLPTRLREPAGAAARDGGPA